MPLEIDAGRKGCKKPEADRNNVDTSALAEEAFVEQLAPDLNSAITHV